MTRNIQYKKLGEICDFISGGTPSKSKNEYWKNGNIPWIKISDFKEKYIKFSEEKITKIGLENSSAKILKKGTILYTIFASVGKVAILDIEATTNQAIVGINLKEDNSIDKDFLYYFLSSIENNIKKQARGVAQNNINISILKNINIPILPMSFQKNIVKTLNKLENILENFKQKKLLINFLNKSLFIKFFGNPEYNEKGWSFSSLKDISLCKGEYGSNKPAINYNGGYRYIRITDITTNGELKKDKVGVLDEEIEAQKYLLKENDILFARSGATVGKNFFYNKKYGKCIFAGYLIRFQLNAHLVSTTYLKKFLETNYYWNWVKNCQNIVAQPNINAKQYGEDLKIMLPPIKLQNKFSEVIEKIEKLSFEIEKSIKEAENLYNSLISKYFD
ncbi:restriction endonuclease subunit S [Fusobacterium periodonticum]|uniref:restriction endonuclease subunit S n=1 Tax=Fusobacterium periodonticum TaxID=860 RepID=UPI0019565A6B|nr:restriction endonuclease subunit S [Fusobacterium periodonticum]VTX87912.1 Type-1 restriction enzyme EcoKI specificity protein [Fusobacterium periodonticum]